jgi:gamma-glutamyltranspeptidase/glutathione hydrolase
VIASVEELFRTHWPTSASVYLREGVPAPGGRLRNRDLALTYHRLLREAKADSGGREQQIDAALAAFYSGFVAEAIENQCHRCADVPLGAFP